MEFLGKKWWFGTVCKSWNGNWDFGTKNDILSQCATYFFAFAFQPWHNRRTSLLVSLVGLIVLTSEATSFVLDNLVVTNTLSSFLTSYALTYSENDFKSLNFSSSNLGFKAILGNAVFILAGKTYFRLLLAPYPMHLDH